MNNRKAFSLDPRYTRRLDPDEGGGFTATVHELPGLIADGDTADEALVNLENAAASWLEAAELSGYKVAEPLDFSGASGKIALRISRRLHRLAAERAELEGTSLNQLISTALASYLGQLDGAEEAFKRIENKMLASMRTALPHHQVFLVMNVSTQIEGASSNRPPERIAPPMFQRSSWEKFSSSPHTVVLENHG